MMENTNLSHQGMQKFNVFSFDNDIFLERATALLQCRKHPLCDVCRHFIFAFKLLWYRDRVTVFIKELKNDHCHLKGVISELTVTPQICCAQDPTPILMCSFST